MAEIHLEKRLDAPIDAVFELLTDHAGYERFGSISSARLAREGETEKNGVGALRELGARPLRFTEEITAFERPTRMDYLIRDANFPIDHDGGSIELRAAGDATEVSWRSTFTMPVPLIGMPLAALGAVALKRGFNSMLNDIERLAREGAGS